MTGNRCRCVSSALGTLMLAASYLLAGLGSPATLAAEVDGFLPTQLDYGYGPEEEESMQLQLQASPELRWDFGTAWRAVTTLRLRVDGEDRLEPGKPALDNYAPASKPLRLGTAGLLELRDVYLERTSSAATWRIGKQQIVWGRLDGIKILDVLNPQDFREFILDDFGASRIGLWSAYLDTSMSGWRTELALIPDGTAHAIPEPGAWFELRAPRFRFGADPATPGLPVTTEAPGHDVSSWGAGVRLSRRLGDVDFSLVGYSGIDPELLGRLACPGPANSCNGAFSVQGFFERREVFGFSAETGFGAWVGRLEYGYQPGRHFNTRRGAVLDTASLNQHRAAVALDVIGPWDVFVNLQLVLDHVSQAPETLVRPAEDRIGTVYLRKSFYYDTVKLEARWYHSFSDGDDHVSLSVAYALSGDTEFHLSADTFSGTEDGLFGQFRDRDRLVLGVRHGF